MLSQSRESNRAWPQRNTTGTPIGSPAPELVLDAGFSIYLESPVHALSKCQLPATLYQADSSGITIAGYDPGMWGGQVTEIAEKIDQAA